MKIWKHPLFSGSVLMIGGNMFANIINYVYQVTMSKTLGVAGYGELSSIFAIFYIVTIVPLSASPAIIKFVSSSENHREAAFVYRKINDLIFKVGIGLAIIVFASSAFLASFLHVKIYEVFVIAPVVFFSLITVSNQALLQGLLKFWGNVGPNIVSSSFKLVFGILFVIIGWKVFGATLGVLFGTTLAYVYSFYLARNFLEKNKAKGNFDFGKFLKYAFPVLVFSFAFTAFFTMDVLLVKHFFNPVDAGIYATLSTLGKIIYFAASPVAGVMFPLVATKHSRGEKYFELLLISLLLTVFVALGIVGFYGLFPHLILSVFVRGTANIPSSLLIWMGFFICFYTISFFMVNFFLSIDEVKIAFLPLVFSILQIILIWFFHTTLLLVIQISLTLMVVLFVFLFSYLVYNRLKYAKTS